MFRNSQRETLDTNKTRFAQAELLEGRCVQ
jgi:hypothetical protein